MNVPGELRYSEDHEWARVDGNRVCLGITDYAQDALGDVVYIELPSVGTEVACGESFSEVESTKSVSGDLRPGFGHGGRRQHRPDRPPRAAERRPYGEGWICVIEASDLSELDSLLDGPAYAELTEGVD